DRHRELDRAERGLPDLENTPHTGPRSRCNVPDADRLTGHAPLLHRWRERLRPPRSCRGRMRYGADARAAPAGVDDATDRTRLVPVHRPPARPAPGPTGHRLSQIHWPAA